MIKLLSRIKLPRIDGELEGSLEQKYRRESLADDIKRATGGIIIFLIASTLFIFNDFALLGDSPLRYGVVAARLLFLVYGIFIILFLRRIKNPDSYDLQMFCLGLFGAALLIFINSTRPALYLGYAFNNIIVLMILYLGFPLKLAFRSAVAGLFTIGCLVQVIANRNGISVSNAMAIVYSLAAVNLGGLYLSHRLNCYQRKQFVAHLAIELDVESLKLAEADLQRQNTLLSALINSPADLTIFSLDKDLRYTAYNENHRLHMLAVWNAQIGPGTKLLDFIGDPGTRELLERNIQRALQGEATVVTEYYPESATWQELSWNTIRQENGEIIGVTVFIKDITAIKQAEAVALETEALKRADKAKSELLANVSHELRTPLASIKGNIETLLADDVAWSQEQQREFLSSANEEADHLTLIIRNLLDMSRLDSGKLNLQKHPCIFQEVLDSASSRLKALTVAHELVFDIQSGIPPVNIDKMRIAQVITNLVENAAKFSPQGTPVSISAELREPGLVISIKDKGVGISPEGKEKLFNRFSQVENVVLGKTRGTGLGLSICKGIVEAHGGTIWAESTVGQGSVFSFSLPLEKPTLP